MISTNEIEKIEKIEIEEKNPKMEKNKREKIWDIVKGVGIISIVIGHATPISEVHDFVYMYHLAIFYFIASYFYNEQKYGNNPGKNLGKKLETNWKKYIFYSTILILLHNVFIKYNFYNLNAEVYIDFESIIIRILNSMTFKGSELFAGALWFVPTLIFALGIFGEIVYVSRKISNILYCKLEKTRKYVKYIMIIFFVSLCGILGVYLNKNAIELNYHIHTVFLILPICALGYFTRKYKNNINKIKKWYIVILILIASTVLLLYFIIKKNMQIELSKEMIVNGYMFYILSFIGICFCISLAIVIEKIPIVNKMMILFGKNSFTIMALHFASMKLVDVVYCKIINETNPEIISKWVTAYPEKLWILYVLIGCILPLIFSMIVEKVKAIIIKYEKEQNNKNFVEISRMEN